MKDRLNLLVLILVLCLGLIFTRIIYIDFFSKNSQKLAYAKSDLMSYERGVIQDRNGNALALSIRQTSIAINPERLKIDRLKEYSTLCNLLNIDYGEFKELSKRDSKFVWLKRKVDNSTLEKIRKLELPGLQFIPEYKRYYPNQHLASHVLGCVGVDNYGLEGLELFFNNELKGDVSDQDFQKEDAAKDSFFKVTEGKRVILTLDKYIQHIVEKEIGKAYIEFKPESITAIVMNPGNGEILAMANLPDFDPNNIKLFSASSLKNRAISDYYEPGSVFKLITLAALYHDKKFPLEGVYKCTGSIKVGNKRIKCWKTHGVINYSDVLKYSCNTALIDRTLSLDPRSFFSVIRNFGFGSMTGIELPGESKGLLRPSSQWTYFSRASIAIGQEIGVTPLQMITAAAAFANGGNLYHPHIVKEITYANGHPYKSYSPIAIRNVMSSVVTKEIKAMMLKVTSKGGTGERASIPKYEIAGKTGTSQVYDVKNKRYYTDKHILSFLGFYPLENPEIIILIVVRMPKNMIDATGGLIAAPIFREISIKINSYLNIIPVGNFVSVNNKAEFPNKGISLKIYDNYEIIPDFSGLNIKQSVILAERLGMTPNFIGSGIAFKQYPNVGVKVDRKIPLTIWFK